MGFLTRLRASRGQSTATSKQPISSAAPEPGQPRFAVLDIETTGLSPDSHRIVEVAVVTTDPWGRVLDEWTTRVNPQGPVGASHIHGITEADVADAPVFHDVIADLTRRLAGAALVAHNARFDLGFLSAEYGRAGWEIPAVPTLCTLEASEYHLPHLERRRLADCCWAVGTPLTGAHSALSDARATAVLLAAFMHPNWGSPPPTNHLALPHDALGVMWPIESTRPTQDGARVQPVSASIRVALVPSVPSASAEALVTLVDRFSLSDALDEGAPAGSITYLETLAEALEDGEITDQESADLAAVAQAMSLNDEDVAAANQALVLALAHGALDDGKVSRAERAELVRVSGLLAVNPKVVPALLDRAELARNARLSAGLEPLPPDWGHGEPLRVGDKVVFTGCEAHGRDLLEARTEELGVRVVGGVSAKTAMLVSDGTMDGTKAAEARLLGTRVVHPHDFRILLAHLQPALPRDAKTLPGTKRLPSAKAPSPMAPPAQIPSDVTPAEVRAWGRENGWEVGVRGRLNQELLAAYIARPLPRHRVRVTADGAARQS
jgi:DNA polymerase-3 subunit epsilon